MFFFPVRNDDLAFHELGSVLAALNYDLNGLISSLASIEFAKLLTQTMHFYADNRVGTLVEIGWPAEYIGGNRIFLERGRFACKGLGAKIFEQFAETGIP